MAVINSVGRGESVFCLLLHYKYTGTEFVILIDKYIQYQTIHKIAAQNEFY
jgi:hypothetical protein